MFCSPKVGVYPRCCFDVTTLSELTVSPKSNRLIIDTNDYPKSIFTNEV